MFKGREDVKASDVIPAKAGIHEKSKAALQEFSLVLPGKDIVSQEAKNAIETKIILFFIQSAFEEAIVSYSLFCPLTIEKIQKYAKQWPSEEAAYESTLNRIYSKSFVFSLDAITKHLDSLCKEHNPPPAVISKCAEYKKKFSHLKEIRDSIAHIEARGRGFNKKNERIDGSVILGDFIGRSCQYTGNDGLRYEVEISEKTIRAALGILQAIIDAYDWDGGREIPEKIRAMTQKDWTI